MIKAGSLLYAIYVCLIISILSGGLIYIFTLNKSLANRQSVKEQLIDRCDSCYNYFLSNAEMLENSVEGKTIDLFEDGLKCKFKKERWGMYSKIIGQAFFKKDTIEKKFIIGQRGSKTPLALYLSDFGEELKISGSTLIKGNVRLPKKRYKVVNIIGNRQKNNPKLIGAVGTSNQNLPTITAPKLLYPKKTIETTIASLKQQEIQYRSFNKETMVIIMDRGASLDRMQLKGNFIITSLDTIRISSTTKLEDVIIQAPKVVIEEGFEGSVQIYANKEAVIESESKLRYPSCIVVQASTRDYEKRVTVAKDAEIYGGIVINGSSFREKQNNYMAIDKDALVVGDIYCNGILELKGSVIGSVYTHKLQLETRSSKYADVILNGIIDTSGIPDNFVGLPLFANTEKKEFEQIKNIQ